MQIKENYCEVVGLISCNVSSAAFGRGIYLTLSLPTSFSYTLLDIMKNKKSCKIWQMSFYRTEAIFLFGRRCSSLKSVAAEPKYKSACWAATTVKYILIILRVSNDNLDNKWLRDWLEMFRCRSILNTDILPSANIFTDGVTFGNKLVPFLKMGKSDRNNDITQNK